MDDSRTLLIDAPSLFYRALFSTPDSVTTPDGVPINAAHGFLWMLSQLISDHDPDFLACAADVDWRPEWRVALISGYKAARAAPGSAQEKAEERLAPQVPVLYALLELLGICVAGAPGFEAEDVIGTLADRARGIVGIVSGDRDLFQLVKDPEVFVIYPKRGVRVVDIVDERYVTEKFKIPAHCYRDFAILRGDASDGLPGVRGIGDAGAAALVSRYGSLEAVIAAAQEGTTGSLLAKVRKDIDYLERAVQVTTIRRDVPLGDLDLSRPRAVDEAVVMAAAERMGLRSSVESVVSALRKTD